MNAETMSMLENLKDLKLSHILRAAADILENKALPKFRSYRPDGWAVVIGNSSFAHRHLIAQALYVQLEVVTEPGHFAGNGDEYKAVFIDRFCLVVRD